MRLVLATYNIHKVWELRNLLKKNNIEILNLNHFSEIKKIKETGKTFMENAFLKAHAVQRYVKYPVLADDSGLEVAYLGNRPGVYSKRYARTDNERINKILGELKKVPFEKRKARFVCAMVLVDPKECHQVIGCCNGYIAEKPVGHNGFGYDPVFFLPDLKKTMAQLSTGEKNVFSHRANALKKIKEILIKNYEL